MPHLSQLRSDQQSDVYDLATSEADKQGMMQLLRCCNRTAADVVADIAVFEADRECQEGLRQLAEKRKAEESCMDEVETLGTVTETLPSGPSLVLADLQSASTTKRMARISNASVVGFIAAGSSASVIDGGGLQLRADPSASPVADRSSDRSRSPRGGASSVAGTEATTRTVLGTRPPVGQRGYTTEDYINVLNEFDILANEQLGVQYRFAVQHLEKLSEDDRLFIELKDHLELIMLSLVNLEN